MQSELIESQPPLDVFFSWSGVGETKKNNVGTNDRLTWFKVTYRDVFFVYGSMEGIYYNLNNLCLKVNISSVEYLGTSSSFVYSILFFENGYCGLNQCQHFSVYSITNMFPSITDINNVFSGDDKMNNSSHQNINLEKSYKL